VIDNGGDPTGLVTAIRWRNWGGCQAVGRGVSAYVGPKTRSVADAKEESATVVAFKLGYCWGRWMYRDVEWYFPQHGDRFNPKNATESCPLADIAMPSGGPLSPAIIPPVQAPCSRKLTVDADGNATPTLCLRGSVNVLAWRRFADPSSQLMRLGPTASVDRVLKAMCFDWKRVYGTLPVTDSVEELSAAYYGWDLAADPTLVFGTGTRCGS